MSQERYDDPVFVAPEQQRVKHTRPGAYKILFVGNSITRHGILPELKWNYEAGMAASSEGMDYMHRTVALLREAYPEREVEAYYGNVNRLIQSKETGAMPLAVLGENLPQPDLVIIQTGEHEGPAKTSAEIARTYEEGIIKPLQLLMPRPDMIATGVWFPTDGAPYPEWVRNIESIYRRICDRYGIGWVSVERYATDPACRGFGENPGVQWHPNDRGMAGYAHELVEAINKIINKILKK